MSHTPGPWVIEKMEYGVFEVRAPEIMEGNQAIMIVQGYSQIAGESSFLANAKLIAAAPDMLAALEWLYRDAVDRGDTKDEHGKEYGDWKAARLAIAKAKGEA